MEPTYMMVIVLIYNENGHAHSRIGSIDWE